MITFVDNAPVIEQRHGHFVLTFTSGGEALAVMISRKALFQLGRRAADESRRAFENDAKILPFRKEGPALTA